MKGLYLYCIRPRIRTPQENQSPTGQVNLVRGKEKSNSQFSVEGIGGGKIFTVPYQDLEAVVSKVSLEEFGSEEIQKKAEEDLNWIKEKAQIHEEVIEQAMGKGSSNIIPVIPMQFGVIFKTKEKLEETLSKNLKKFRKSLEYLTEKQEWAVKVYLNRKSFEKEIKKVSPVVQEKEKEIAQLPEGMAYFLQKQIDDTVSKEADKAIENYIESFFETLKKYAEASTKGKILEKELTGKSLPMVLSAIFLVSEEKLEDFIKEIDKLNRDYKPKGFNFEYSGPWPSYNFI